MDLKTMSSIKTFFYPKTNFQIINRVFQLLNKIKLGQILTKMNLNMSFSGLEYHRCLRNRYEIHLLLKNKKRHLNPCTRASFFLAAVSGELTLG